MPDYQKSKIYKIVCDVTNLTYYGSTIQPLSKRMGEHRAKRNVCSTKDMIEPKIYLVEEFPCDNKEQLLQRERYYIENNICCNKQVPLRSNKEYYEDNKDKIAEYYLDNKDKKKEYQKEYREANKDKIVEYKKEYYEANKDKIAERDKEYREANKDKISERRKIKIKCECGSEVRKSDIQRHKRTIKHINYINKSITL
jgi:hypothetical protein